MTRGRRGQVLCYGCQEPGHVIANCPHRAESKGVTGMAVAYNQPSEVHPRTNNSAQDMARAMDVN